MSTESEPSQSCARFELDEALMHLTDFINELKLGEYDEDGEYCFQTGIQHIYEHLNMAFHTKNIPIEHLGQISQAEYETLSDTFPPILEKLHQEWS